MTHHWSGMRLLTGIIWRIRDYAGYVAANGLPLIIGENNSADKAFYNHEKPLTDLPNLSINLNGRSSKTMGIRRRIHETNW